MRLLLWSVAFLVATTVPATAQPPDVLIYCCAGLSGVYDGTAVQVRVQLRAQSVNTPFRIDEVAGLDIYRVTGGSAPCSQPVRMTTTPIPWTRADALDQIFTDPVVEPNRVYSYHVVAVDAHRTPLDLQWGWGFPLDCWVRTGDVPIGHGFIERYAPSDAYVEPCANECYPAAGDVIVPAQLRPYLDSGISLFLYGNNINCCGHPQFGSPLVVASGRPSACTEAVTPSSWGLVKQLYRD